MNGLLYSYMDEFVKDVCCLKLLSDTMSLYYTLAKQSRVPHSGQEFLNLFLFSIVLWSSQFDSANTNEINMTYT